MPVRIRLRRMGRRKQPHYRIVVADSAKPRDGRFVENLGYYKPLSDPARLVLDLERVDHWMGQGALPSHTVRTLVNKARKGGDAAVALGEPAPGGPRVAEVPVNGRAAEDDPAEEAGTEGEAAAVEEPVEERPEEEAQADTEGEAGPEAKRPGEEQVAEEEVRAGRPDSEGEGAASPEAEQAAEEPEAEQAEEEDLPG